MQRMLSFAGPLASVTRSHLDSLSVPVMSDSPSGGATRLCSTTHGDPGTLPVLFQQDTAELAATAR